MNEQELHEKRSAAAKKAAETRRANRLAAEESREEETTNSSWNWQWLGWVLLGIFVLGMLIWHPWRNGPAAPTATETPVVTAEEPVAKVTEAPVIPTEAPVIQPTSAAIQSSMAQVEVPVEPVLVSDPAPTCPNWDASKEVTQMLSPGMTAIGDVLVDDVIQYDEGGSGESTIVVNLSSKDVKIFAQWGSGCEWTTDVESVVQKQRFAGCGDSNDDGVVDMCNSVRIVLITDLGTEVKFVTPNVK